MVLVISPILLVGLKKYCVLSQSDHILNMHLRNHYMVSILIRLRNHYVVSQFDPILIIRLKNHYLVSQKLCISESKQFFKKDHLLEMMMGENQRIF